MCFDLLMVGMIGRDLESRTKRCTVVRKGGFFDTSNHFFGKQIVALCIFLNGLSNWSSRHTVHGSRGGYHVYL